MVTLSNTEYLELIKNKELISELLKKEKEYKEKIVTLELDVINALENAKTKIVYISKEEIVETLVVNNIDYKTKARTFAETILHSMYFNSSQQIIEDLKKVFFTIEKSSRKINHMEFYNLEEVSKKANNYYKDKLLKIETYYNEKLLILENHNKDLHNKYIKIKDDLESQEKTNIAIDNKMIFYNGKFYNISQLLSKQTRWNKSYILKQIALCIPQQNYLK